MDKKQLSRHQWFVIGAVLIGIGLVFQCAVLALVEPFQTAQSLWLIGTSAIVVSSAYPFWVGTRFRDTAPEKLELAQREFEDSCREAEDKLRKQAEILEKRERNLAERFLQYQTWMEYPLDFNESHDLDEEVGEQPSEEKSQEELEKSEELSAKDQAVAELLEREAEKFFDRIKRNDYTIDGKFRWEPLRDDLVDLATSVAKVYHPEAENPLMETSVEQLLRAASRICLHVLVLMERIPVNIASYNLRELYTYVRRAVLAYQVYQTVRPYLPYAHYASYAGRIILGSNPVTLGAQWALWKIGSKGATAATKHIVNRQAMLFMHDTLAIVGHEVAGVYGGDFRHRDKNWIYGAELSDLLHRFPLSRESLVKAFGDIGSLPMRSEYDRVFLFRCIAGHRSAGPDRFNAKTLTAKDRHWVAKRLQKFANQNVTRGDTDALAKWEQDCRDRLGVAVNVEREASPHSEHDQLGSAFESLIGFCIVGRQVDTDQLEALLEPTKLGSRLGKSKRDELIELARKTPPTSFELPDLEADSSVVTTLIEDMLEVIVETANEQGASLESIEWVGEYFRVDEKVLQKTVSQKLQSLFEARWAPTSSPPRLTLTANCRLAERVPQGELVQMAYLNPIVSRGGTGNAPSGMSESRLVLVGWGTQIELLDTESDQAYWSSNGAPIQIESERRLLNTSVTLTGGEWLVDELKEAQIVISRTAATGQDAHFEPLKQMVERCAPKLSEESSDDD